MVITPSIDWQTDMYTIENRQVGQNINKLLFHVKTPDDGYRVLGVAVIADSAEDWRKARKIGDIYGMRREERFFKSELFSIYSGGMSGEYLLRKLREERG